MSNQERRAGVPVGPDQPVPRPRGPYPQQPGNTERDPLQLPWNDPESPGKYGVPTEHPQPVVVPVEPS